MSTSLISFEKDWPLSSPTLDLSLDFSPSSSASSSSSSNSSSTSYDTHSRQTPSTPSSTPHPLSPASDLATYELERLKPIESSLDAFLAEVDAWLLRTSENMRYLESRHHKSMSCVRLSSTPTVTSPHDDRDGDLPAALSESIILSSSGSESSTSSSSTEMPTWVSDGMELSEDRNAGANFAGRAVDKEIRSRRRGRAFSVGKK